jgi:hypothetical protein
MGDIRKQFSLDWLTGDTGRGTAEATSPAQSSLSEAVIFYSQPIMESLAATPEMRLHDLAKDVSHKFSEFKFEEFSEVIKYLGELGIVGIADEDPTGNYLITLLKKR